MIIAIASGEGGTGKTTIATSLALCLVAKPSPPVPLDASSLPLFLDCDVEAPNAHLFLKPVFDQCHQVGVLIPQVDEALCVHCGTCAQVCQFHAIAVLGEKTLVFPQLCHGCGTCTLMCPQSAISETLQVVGVLERGPTPSGVQFARGVLNIGEPMAVPLIRQLKAWIDPQADQVVIVDAPPGTSCPVVASVSGADFLLLVTEPTPSGFHDLKLAVEVARELHIPAGVVLNRYVVDSPDGRYNTVVETFCQEQGLPILLRIPFEREIAAGIARGKTLTEFKPGFVSVFQELLARITTEVQTGVQIQRF
jgi:MinD superfamily P-loop ATPase